MPDTQKDLHKKFLGRKGEELTVKELKKSGYKSIKRNVVTPFGAADIVCEKDGKTIFVEVKTRSGKAFGLPCEAVDSKKQAKYRRIADFLLGGADGKDVGFAVAEVTEEGVNIIFDAF